MGPCLEGGAFSKRRKFPELTVKINEQAILTNQKGLLH